MKRFLTTLFSFIVLGSALAQKNNDAPYLKQKTLPAFTLQKISKGNFTKANLPAGKPVVIFVFSPTCGHCAQESRQIIQEMQSLKKLSFVYASISSDQRQIEEFIYETGIDAYPNIYIGIDTNLKLASFFRPTVTPFAAVYNKKQQLVHAFTDGYVMPKLLNIVKAL